MAGKIPTRSILGPRHIGDGDNAPAASLATAHKEELEQEPKYSGIYGLVVDDIVHHKVMEHDHEHGEDPQQLNGRVASTPPPERFCPARRLGYLKTCFSQMLY